MSKELNAFAQDSPHLLNTPIIQQVSVSVLDFQWSVEKRRMDSIERNRGKGQSKNIGVKYRRQSVMFLCVNGCFVSLLTSYINSNLQNLFSFVLTCVHKLFLFFYAN